MGNIDFGPLVVLAKIGIAAIALLALALVIGVPYAAFWAWHHVTVVIR